MPASGKIHSSILAQPNPLIGDMWFDTSGLVLYVWNGTRWAMVTDNAQDFVVATEPVGPVYVAPSTIKPKRKVARMRNGDD